MNRHATLPGLCLLAASLSACSTYAAWRKCGFSGCPGDKQIATQVAAALRQTPGIGYWNVTVESLDGIVYLYGLVDTNPERARIEEVAAQSSGGRKIVDSIEVRRRY